MSKKITFLALGLWAALAVAAHAQEAKDKPRAEAGRKPSEILMAIESRPDFARLDTDQAELQRVEERPVRSLRGEDTKVGEGLAGALRLIGPILGWSLVAATVGGRRPSSGRN